ncbi:DUF1656 domain-containing protein [Aureimonas glaciei]|uniref:DUF1656 domain-containing protein n=1 Tax=Aureimonas glaciei TaxID=1776957 RepID=A0A916XWN4_9HYPH|nr:DUF1656 domain-containing protein [Aureimonas glaciei]GGD18020.1 DUF1656 domain-containing protein [Aureimonas glaciei]
MTGDFSLFGVFVPKILVLALVAYGLNLVLKRVLASTGFYRLVWHPALFDLALFVLVLSGLAIAAQQVSP